MDLVSHSNIRSARRTTGALSLKGSATDSPAGAAPSATAITLAWLVRLRWGGGLGQAMTIGVAVLGLGLDLRLVPLVALVATTLASNLALVAWLRRIRDVPSRSMGLVLTLDTLILSGLLYFSGGPANPFSIFYLVHVTLAALVLGMRWAGGMVALSAALYASLFFWHAPVAGMEHAHHGGPAFSVHLQGMWIAFTLAASLIAYFVARVAAALREREEDLARARQLAARSEKLASLTTLAAGAAHELGTPLGTIAIASKELERSILTNPVDAIGDARLIRTEVDRCRAIVQRMSATAGTMAGEIPDATTAQVVFERCVERLGHDATARVSLAHGDPVRFLCPVEGVVQVLQSLVQNGLYASRASGAHVTLSCVETASAIRLVVEDSGVGIGADDLAHVGEPFFTTKPPGEGMGLGVFLAYAFAERCGGRLEIDSRKGVGTKVTIELPRLPGRSHE